MKRYSFICTILTMALMLPQARAQEKNASLSYMLEKGVDQAFAFAKEKNKAVLVYFNSAECHSCQQFSGQIMTDKEVIDNVKADYISINANIKNLDARKWSKKFKAFMLPAIVLVSPEQDFHYTCALKLDKVDLMGQMKNFFNAVAFRNQILLLQRTKNVSFEEACDEMGASYGKIDFRRNPNQDPEEAFISRTLNMSFFDKCMEAYLDAWEQQKGKEKAKSINWKPATK